MKQTSDSSTLFDFYGKPSFNQVFPLALRRVVAAIMDCVTPAAIVSGATGLSPADKVFLIQAALVVSGLSTLLQLFPISNKNGIHIGSTLPVIMGISLAHVLSMQATAGYESDLDIPMILGAEVVGSVVAILIGFSVKKIRKLFPPLITGTVAFTIDLPLYPTAVNYTVGGAGKPLASKIRELGFGSWQNWAATLTTLAVAIALNHYTKGILKLASILVGVIVGYITALCFGLVDFSGVATAGLFQFPAPLHFDIIFEPSACIAIGLLFAISSIRAIGDFFAMTIGSMNRMPEDKELQGGIICYSISSIVGAVLGGLPTATYSQNVDIVMTTKAINRIVFSSAAAILLVAGLIPKFSAVLTTVPQCVLGSTTISAFASIAITGIRLVVAEEMSYHNTSIVGLSVALGMGVTQAASSLAAFLDWTTITFDKSPVVVATCVVILLNVTLPKENAQKAE